MTLKFSPEDSRRLQGGGASLQKYRDKRQKQWLTSNFRLKIDGLDRAASRVNKIEAITIKQAIVSSPAGSSRDYVRESGAIEIPNLSVSLPERDGGEVFAWEESFLIKGENTDKDEKTGSLTYLADDGTTELFTLDFAGLGLFKVRPDKMESGAEGIRRFKAEMYCEEMDFHWSPSATQ